MNALLPANPILNTDSYKTSHWLQYPPGTDAMLSYVESRGGRFDRLLWFGLQAILKEYLAQPISRAHIEEAEEVLRLHGVPFNRSGFDYLIERHGGHWPVEIRALPEGTVAPTGVPLLTIASTDPAAFWAVSYLETLLMRVWYPTTVATQSWHARRLIQRYLDKTADSAESLPFKLHDFGARGVSSYESAALGGMAHLVNFLGTDTLAALVAARRYYDAGPACAYSIPAAEHSTITSWGPQGEVDAYRNMLERFAKPGAVVAVVSDSYDIFHAVEKLWGGELRQQVIDSGATLVVRPDSGDPATIVSQVVQRLDAAFGSTVNSKGFKLLNHVRVIQGDGVNLNSMELILGGLSARGYSTDNVAFGMGGALLQQLDRDTQRFAMKCCAVRVNGSWREVFKAPVTDPGKRSKAGLLTTYRLADGSLQWGLQGQVPAGAEEALLPVWRHGELLLEQNFAQIRQRAAA
ncbi:nicotinate phosphoribosyltransferase [Chitinimonas lacunae]|uniref:Nicotinamide phosphoribosyltransferase n=1 Tax=Chitinimonas lacunae TaxID=1963018 RepID=A0ABV8MME3_9NEIS